MPTLPSDRRDMAGSFGADAERYDRTRPHYPAEMVGELVEAPARVLDVGIGTGISALPFHEAGCTVLGIEPDERMAALARARGFEVEIARFEEWDPAGRTFDAVVAGTTWHWVDAAAGARRAAEVLPAGGRFAAFWNVGDPPPEVAAGFAAVYAAVDHGLPIAPPSGSMREGYQRILDVAAEGLRASGAFTEPDRLRWDRRVTLTRDRWLDQAQTSGGHQLLPPHVRAALLDGMGEVVDRVGGSFVMEYATLALRARRR